MRHAPIIKISKQNLPPIPQELKAQYPNCGVPKGYQGVDKISFKLGQLAQELLKSTKKEVGFTYIEDGVEYLIKADLHFDNHTNRKAPPCWHRGVSVYKKIPNATSDIQDKMKIKKYPQKELSEKKEPPKAAEPSPIKDSAPPKEEGTYQQIISKLSDLYKKFVS